MQVEIVRHRRRGARGGSVVALRRAVRAVLLAEAMPQAEVAVLLTDNREIQRLNAQFRGFDKPTDVLAFPLQEVGAIAACHLGDVVISIEKAEQQARARGVSLDAELELLVVHGTLHLLGYDHDRADRAQKMRKRTRLIRSQLRRDRAKAR